MVTINLDTARARLRTAAERHCPRCYPGSMVKTGPDSNDWEPVASGVASGLELDAAALAYASAMRREPHWSRLTPALPGLLIGNVATLVAVDHAPPLWMILVALVAATLSLAGAIARRS